jgi:hypothetical protein
MPGCLKCDTCSWWNALNGCGRVHPEDHKPLTPMKPVCGYSEFEAVIPLGYTPIATKGEHHAS